MNGIASVTSAARVIIYSRSVIGLLTTNCYPLPPASNDVEDAAGWRLESWLGDVLVIVLVVRSINSDLSCWRYRASLKAVGIEQR